MNSELKVFARLFSKSESSYFVFLFYKRYIILNSLAACRALYKCIRHMNSELKVFAKLSSESVFSGFLYQQEHHRQGTLP